MLLASSSRLRPASVSAEAGRSANAVEAGELELLARHSIAAATLSCLPPNRAAGRDVLQHTHARKRLHDLEGAGEAARARLSNGRCAVSVDALETDVT